MLTKNHSISLTFSFDAPQGARLKKYFSQGNNFWEFYQVLFRMKIERFEIDRNGNAIQSISMNIVYYKEYNQVLRHFDDLFQKYIDIGSKIKL